MMVPPSVIAHAEEIREYLSQTDDSDVRIEITARGVVVRRMETLVSKRY